MDPLISLAPATAAFVGTHLIMSHPLRPALVRGLGEGGFAGVYSLIALLTLGWMILAYRAGEMGTPLWVAPPWAWWIGSGVLLIASILLVGSLVRNPAFPSVGARPTQIPPPTGVFAITRHPMNWSFMLWAGTHIALIGTPRNLIIAGGILLLALVGSIGQDAKKVRLLGPVWQEWQARTSFVPFAAVAGGRVRTGQAVPGAIALVGGLLLWAAVTWVHAPEWGPRALMG
jgi:uncharacterized membrane protein